MRRALLLWIALRSLFEVEKTEIRGVAFQDTKSPLLLNNLKIVVNVLFFEQSIGTYGLYHRHQSGTR